MKKYNYFYNGQAITRSQFLDNVPENWEQDLDEYGNYSWGYYNAYALDQDEVQAN